MHCLCVCVRLSALRLISASGLQGYMYCTYLLVTVNAGLCVEFDKNVRVESYKKYLLLSLASRTIRSMYEL